MLKTNWRYGPNVSNFFHFENIPGRPLLPKTLSRPRNPLAPLEISLPSMQLVDGSNPSGSVNNKKASWLIIPRHTAGFLLMGPAMSPQAELVGSR